MELAAGDVTDTRIEAWMRHSLRLATARRDQPAHVYDQEDSGLYSCLYREVKLREWVLARWHRPDLLDGSAYVWWAYCVRHARLQIARYAGLMGDDEFLSACKRLRAERETADAQVQHQLWGKPRQETV